MKTKRFHALFRADRLVLALCCAAALWTCRDFLVSDAPSGWDTVPQIYLFFKMAHLVKHGTVFGYDPQWFGGFPVFIFYGFLPYLLAAIIHHLSFGAISVLTLAKLSIVGTPILFFISVYLFVGVFFGRQNRAAGLLISLMYMYHALTPHLGMGISGAVYHGLFLTLLGTSLILLILGCLEYYTQTNRRTYFIAAVLLTVSLIFTHMISTIAGGVILGLYFATQRQYRTAAQFVFWTTGLTAFYLYPFIRYGDLLNDYQLAAGRFTSLELIGLSLMQPFLARNVLIAALAIGGLLTLLRRKQLFVPLVIGSYLLFVPTNLLFNHTSLGLHYFRFDNYFVVFYLMLAVAGWSALARWASKWHLFRWAYIPFIALTLLPIADFPFTPTHINLNEDYFDEKQLLDHIKNIHPTGRVFVERSNNVPNPNFFNAYLPLYSDAAVITGLLVESSDNSRFIMPTLKTISATLTWGGAQYKLKIPLRDAFKKLSDAGVEVVCLNGHKLPSRISNEATAWAQSTNKVGNYIVYRNGQYLPLLSKLRHEPILLINRSKKYSNTTWLTWFFRSTMKPEIKLAIWSNKPALSNATKALFSNVIQLDDTMHSNTIAEQLNSSVKISTSTIAIQPEIADDSKIVFTATGPVVVNLGYFPYWTSPNPVFRLSPSKLLVFADGRTTLEFKLPLIQKILMAVAALALVGLMLLR